MMQSKFWLSKMLEWYLVFHLMQLQRKVGKGEAELRNLLDSFTFVKKQLWIESILGWMEEKIGLADTPIFC